jgi:hypothetical protein
MCAAALLASAKKLRSCHSFNRSLWQAAVESSPRLRLASINSWSTCTTQREPSARDTAHSFVLSAQHQYINQFQAGHATEAVLQKSGTCACHCFEAPGHVDHWSQGCQSHCKQTTSSEITSTVCSTQRARCPHGRQCTLSLASPRHQPQRTWDLRSESACPHHPDRMAPYPGTQAKQIRLHARTLSQSPSTRLCCSPSLCQHPQALSHQACLAPEH